MPETQKTAEVIPFVLPYNEILAAIITELKEEGYEFNPDEIRMYKKSVRPETHPGYQEAYSFCSNAIWRDHKQYRLSIVIYKHDGKWKKQVAVT